MLSWSDIGSLWRNLYLLSSLITAVGLGTLFARHAWPSKRRAVSFLFGVSATPLAQYLWTLLLALVWPKASRYLYIGALPLLAGGYLLYLLIRFRRRLLPCLKEDAAKLRALRSLDKAAVLCLTLALALLIVLSPAAKILLSRNDNGTSDAGEYMALGLRYCEDRDLSYLLAKDYPDGHFRGHSHFPSMELYFAHGLMFTGGDYGYPNDKAAFTGVGLLNVYFFCAFAALLILLCRGRARWVALGVLLLGLVPGLGSSILYAPRDIWRMLGICLFCIYLLELTPEGNGKTLLGKCLGMALLGFVCMSLHVVCFVVLPFLVIAWVLWRFALSFAMRPRRVGRTLLRCVLLALCAAVGVAAAFSGNIYCYLKWGVMMPPRLMQAMTEQPWYELYATMEYRVEALHTSVDFWRHGYDVMLGFVTNLGVWGACVGALSLAVCVAALIRVCRKGREPSECLSQPQDPLQTVLFASCATLLCLLPMTGLIDTSIYSFSGAFLSISRYMEQWFMLCCGMICAALAALETAWLCCSAWLASRVPRVKRLAQNAVWRRLPALLCAVLCLFTLWRGARGAFYDDTVYGALAASGFSEAEEHRQDAGFRAKYLTLMELNARLEPDQKIILTNVGDQYAVRGQGYPVQVNANAVLLGASLEEVPTLLEDMNIAVVATNIDYWDTRYLPLSFFGQYLQSLPSEQIVEDGYMRFYILDESLVGQTTAWAAETRAYAESLTPEN